MPSVLSAQDREDAHEQVSRGNSEADKYLLEILLKDMPPHTMPDPYANTLTHMPGGSKDIGWQHCLRAVEKHDGDLCQAYREQIDTLLVFAGLFSSVVTAFAVESYQWLLDDPADTSAELLRDVTRLVAQSLNQTVASSLPSAKRLPDAATARINVFWFLSLTLSLSAALIGILCKQWLREFERDVGQSPETALGVRHNRYQGLTYWKVGSIVNSVPILLQLSLALFLTGIVELLWRLHFTVAITVSLVAGATLAFYMTTTLLPLLQYTYIILRLCGRITPQIEKYMLSKAFAEPQCAFKSAQAWISLRAVQPVIEYLIKRYCGVFAAYRDESSPLTLRPADSWITFDINWMKRRDCIHRGATSAFETLAWVAKNLDERQLKVSIWQCAWDRWLQSRSFKEDHVPSAMDLECVSHAFAGPDDLDVDSSANIRGQAAVFRCSLHTTLPLVTGIEMILRIAPEIGVDSRWTSEAVRAVCDVYRNMPIHLSDYIAIGLFRLAMLQTQAIIRRQSTTNATESSLTHWHGTEAFFQVFRLLHRCIAEERVQLLPAMCALVLQWLRAHPGQISTRGPRTSNADYAEEIAKGIISFYAYLPDCDPARLHETPGVIFPARLVAMVVDLSHGVRSSVGPKDG